MEQQIDRLVEWMTETDGEGQLPRNHRSLFGIVFIGLGMVTFILVMSHMSENFFDLFRLGSPPYLYIVFYFIFLYILTGIGLFFVTMGIRFLWKR